jgi:hypothetical protein
MTGNLDSRTRLGVVAIIVCTFALWLILGAGAELARLIAGAAVALAAGLWSALDASLLPPINQSGQQKTHS